MFFIKFLNPLQNLKDFFTKLFKGSFYESLLIAAMVFAVSFFTQSLTPILFTALLIICKNFILRSMRLYFETTHFPFKDALCIVLNFFIAAQFAYIFNGLIITLIHEIGHVLAALIMYVTPSPSITIFPFSGAEMQYSAEKLTAVGEFLGEPLANGIIAGAGSVLTLFVSLFLLYFAKKKDPKTPAYAYLTTSALYVLAADALYAFSALESTSTGHDFLSLWQMGIHPIFCAFLLLALPYLFFKFLTAGKSLRSLLKKA